MRVCVRACEWDRVGVLSHTFGLLVEEIEDEFLSQMKRKDKCRMKTTTNREGEKEIEVVAKELSFGLNDESNKFDWNKLDSKYIDKIGSNAVSLKETGSNKVRSNEMSLPEKGCNVS